MRPHGDNFRNNTEYLDFTKTNIWSNNMVFDKPGNML